MSSEATKEERLKSQDVAARDRAARRDRSIKARKAHNAAIKSRTTTNQDDRNRLGSEIFARLLREWWQAIDYVHRFSKIDENAPDVVSARDRADAIEREWLRIADLPEDHPDYFKWPSTEAPMGHGGLGFSNWEAMGMLAYIGYKVGAGSPLVDEQRRALLLRIFAMNLPPLNGPDYLREWGAPSSPSRLRKMAESVAALARNAKRRRNASWQIAINHWETDLRFLRARLYVGKFGFGWAWPVT